MIRYVSECRGALPWRVAVNTPLPSLFLPVHVETLDGGTVPHVAPSSTLGPVWGRRDRHHTQDTLLGRGTAALSKGHL